MSNKVIAEIRVTEALKYFWHFKALEFGSGLKTYLLVNILTFWGN
jgi:hypothetical protein